MKTSLRYLFGLVLALGLLFGSLSSARAGVFINVGIAPPELPVYAQPACPGLGYIWTPGYWAWDADADSYYWVPGAWALAPEVGFLWTPGYWGYGNGGYFYNSGYWGPQVGFYGGINYGFGYNGRGYDGGYWHNRQFYYNREVNNVRSIEASRLYSRSVEGAHSRTSFNGPGGINARATDAEIAAAREHHVGATPAQNAQIRAAMADPGMRYSSNHGKPAVTGIARAGDFRSTTASTENRTAQRAPDTAYTGASRAATERAATERTASDTHTAQARTESRLTEERTARANEARTAAATESRRAAVTRSESQVAERSHSESHSFATASHAPAYRASASHGAPSGGGAAAHASAGGGRPR